MSQNVSEGGGHIYAQKALDFQVILDVVAREDTF